MTYTNSQNIKGAYSAYCNSNDRTIWQAYDKPSWNKESAYIDCVHKMQEMEGEDGRIVSYNTFSFSYGFRAVVDGKKSFVWITPSYVRYTYL